MGAAAFAIVVFPGLLFLGALALAGEWVDRKLYARLQNRIGPPWFHPLADLLKLFSKESVVPEAADRPLFSLAPLFALASAATAFLSIPLFGLRGVYSVRGDLIVVLYLLMIPTLTLFLGGWYSRSLFSTLGAMRALTQLFAYEVPLFASVLAPALLAGSWTLSEITAFYAAHRWWWAVNLPGFAVALVALLGKLERTPFDIPEAETEIVAGCLTEYSGRFLGFYRLAIDMEMVAGASLLAALFLPFGLALPPVLSFALYLAKLVLVIALLTLLRTLFARLRIDQMVSFCFRYLAPAAFAQVLVNLALMGVVR